MAETKSTTEHAAEIRATLKREHGWTARQVSVKSDHFAMGSSIDVIVKDPSISLPIVKAIAEPAESVRRCEITGEILSGGNRYLHVRYSHEVMEIIGRRYADAVQRAVNTIAPDNDRSLVNVDGTPFLIGRPHAGCLSLWDDRSYIQDGYTVDQIAQTIGGLMVARQEG
jgi:hypothetical protein